VTIQDTVYTAHIGISAFEHKRLLYLSSQASQGKSAKHGEKRVAGSGDFGHATNRLRK